MKRTLLPLTVALYLSDVLFIVMGNVEADWLAYFWLAMVPVTIILAVLNIVFALVDRKTNLRSAVVNTFIFKIILIPHYIFTFVISVILFVFGIFSAFTIFWLASLPILLIVFLCYAFTWFIMFSTGACNVVSLIRERKKLPLPFVLVNVVCQFIFFVDLFDAVYLLYYVKKNRL